MIYTFAFRWAENKLERSVNYICLITLTDQELIPLQEELDRKFSQIVGKHSSRWQRHPIKSCIVMNIATWNACFDEWKIERNTPIQGGAQ